MEVSFVSSVLSFVIVLIIVARDTVFSFFFTCRYLASLDLFFFHVLIRFTMIFTRRCVERSNDRVLLWSLN